MIHDAIWFGIGFVVAAFTPSFGRAIKNLFIKETTAVKAKL